MNKLNYGHHFSSRVTSKSYVLPAINTFAFIAAINIFALITALRETSGSFEFAIINTFAISES